MTVGLDNAPHCPKCGAPMVYMVEKERNGSGVTRITRYFRCTACGTKVIDEQLVIKPVNGVIQVVRLAVAKKVIYSSYTPKRAVRNGRAPRAPRRQPRRG